MKNKKIKIPFLPRGFRAPAQIENCPLARQTITASKIYQQLQNCPKNNVDDCRTIRQPSLNQLLTLAVNDLPQNSVRGEELHTWASHPTSLALNALT